MSENITKRKFNAERNIPLFWIVSAFWSGATEIAGGAVALCSNVFRTIGVIRGACYILMLAAGVYLETLLPWASLVILVLFFIDLALFILTYSADKQNTDC